MHSVSLLARFENHSKSCDCFFPLQMKSSVSHMQVLSWISVCSISIQSLTTLWCEIIWFFFFYFLIKIWQLKRRSTLESAGTAGAAVITVSQVQGWSPAMCSCWQRCAHFDQSKRRLESERAGITAGCTKQMSLYQPAFVSQLCKQTEKVKGQTWGAASNTVCDYKKKKNKTRQIFFCLQSRKN